MSSQEWAKDAVRRMLENCVAMLETQARVNLAAVHAVAKRLGL
jgi:hypothetical protein